MSAKIVLDSFSLVSFFQLPITILSVDDHLVKEAAEIKAEYPVSHADAFFIATAQRSKAGILTNDREFKSVQHLVTVRWIAE
jgi:predicted nucleic acid-binding protein